MAEVPDIHPIQPSWPVRPGEKPGERGRRREQPEKRRKPQNTQDDDDDAHQHIDEYA